MAEDITARCGHKDCTCHAHDGAAYCSESCRRAAESGATGCRCGHAGCTASAYSRKRAGESETERPGARHSH